MGDAVKISWPAGGYLSTEQRRLRQEFQGHRNLRRLDDRQDLPGLEPDRDAFHRAICCHAFRESVQIVSREFCGHQGAILDVILPNNTSSHADAEILAGHFRVATVHVNMGRQVMGDSRIRISACGDRR